MTSPNHQRLRKWGMCQSIVRSGSSSTRELARKNRLSFHHFLDLTMKIAAALLALTGAASAFTAPSVSTKSTALQGTVFEDYDGNVNLFGAKFDFDPFNLAETYYPFVPFFREAELRNGRTAMLAVLGYITADFVRIPGEQFSFEAVPHVYQAHDALPDSMIQIAGWIALFDICITAPAIAAMNKGEREPGDFGWDPIGRAKNKTPEQLEKLKNSELMNGRLAMWAIGGIATQSVLTGHDFPYI